MDYRWFRNSKVLLLSPLLILLIIVIGCGGQSAATAPAAAPAATTAPAAAAPAATTAPVSTSQSPASSAAATDVPVSAATTAPEPIVADTGKVGGVLRTQVFGFPAQTFTPHVNWQAFVFAGGAWSLLVEFDPTTPDPFDIRPDLAKSWDISEDGLTYTFALHDNVRNHDGTPVTADDVVFSMDRMTRLRGSTRSLLKTYYEEGNTQAIDQHTVAITTKFPTQDLLNQSQGGMRRVMG